MSDSITSCLNIVQVVPEQNSRIRGVERRSRTNENRALVQRQI